MIRAPRPKSQRVQSAHPVRQLFCRVVFLAGAALMPVAAWAQSPLASSYATRDGRAPTTVLGCVSVDGSYTVQPCGVIGYPLHVTIDGGSVGGSSGSTTPTTAAGTASPQLVGIQGGGSNALAVSVLDPTVAQVVVQSQLAATALGTPNDAAATSTGSVVSQLRRIGNALTVAPNGPLNTDGGQQVHVMNLPATQPVSAAALPLPAGAATAAAQPALSGDGGALAHVANFPATQPVSAASLPLPAGAASAALQPAVNGDGGSQVHVQNFPSTQAVSAAALPLPAGAATAALQPAVNTDGGSQVHVQNFPSNQIVTNAGSFAVQDSAVIASNAVIATNTAARTGAWSDASFTATGTASSPASLGAVASRIGLHVWNLGASAVCMNYTSAAALNGSACAAGSVPIPAGSAYLEDQPGNVSPEAISFVCAGSSCPLTIKVR